MDKIKNLSLRKAIVLYMTVSLVICFFLSAGIVRMAITIQNNVWWKYVDQEKYFEMAQSDEGGYLTDVPRPLSYEMEKFDYHISESCDFLQTYSVLIVSVIGSVVAVFLFYKHKLKNPIEELELASQQIAYNNLDFHVTYENKDEMGRLCREFERMREQLAENNQQLWKTIEEEKALRAAIAHDIRSPLSVLEGYQEMLSEYLPGEEIDLDQALEMVNESRKQIERMDAFVETMGKMSSLEARKLIAEEITNEQLETDIQAEVHVLEKKFGKGCDLKCITTEEKFSGDKEVILEVTENLLSNALRYARTKVEIVVILTGSELKIRVKDDGVGFSSDKEKVTKLFYQQNMKDSLKHTGIGMYISRLYCEKHGGQLLLENEEHGGAVITAVFHRIA
ncbi:MAG: HAMP domain-containing sensor histidine kinase [Lachnospiraceae bacterium]|nr:HAMP domain-containing sensor histidine kinase [Lachnospiraceae bacterium]